MEKMSLFYWYGVSATVYMITCWMFAITRWFHTCHAPKNQRSSIWPDRKLQVIIYLRSIFLIPYILNPSDPRAWTMWKSYFPCTYYFYSAVMLFCYFGTVKQWNQWKNIGWIAALVTTIAMAPLAIDAWVPGGMMKPHFVEIWNNVVLAVSFCMMCYSAVAVWQVRRWTKEACDENYSNPDDFPEVYARRVWLIPLWITPLIWPAYLLDSPKVMAVMNIFLSIFNATLLIMAMPQWRRKNVVVAEEPEDADEGGEWRDGKAEERARKIAEEIEHIVKAKHAFLNPHLKIDHVVEHCSYSRTYVSHVFKTHFGGFSHYVNKLRIDYYDQYVKKHPGVTKDAAAQECGFSSYVAYYKAKDRLEHNY